VKVLLSIITNKYLLTLLILGLWVVFFDKNDVLTQMEFSKQLAELEKEKTYYLKEIANNKSKLKELQTSDIGIEKFAREQYLMHKEGEEIFVIVYDSTYNAN
jgi:cell division protein DivIC